MREYDEYYDFDEDPDYVPVEEVIKYESLKEHIQTVIDNFYYKGNIYAIEEALDEIAGIYDIKMPVKSSVLTKKIR